MLNSAVDVSDLFLEQGNIVSTKGRDSAVDASYRARPGDILDGVPLVVMVNGGSASASEIVAGALQDHERAIIMGTRTFGKGSVQTVIPMNNGGALKLTTARYYTPDDRSIQARGIEPDIMIEQRELSDATQDGKIVRESDLAGHLSNGDEQSEGEEDPDSAEGESEMPRGPSELLRQDYQLSEALNILKGMSLVHNRLRAESG